MVIGIYVRVSTKIQIDDGSSINNQIKYGIDFCNKKGFEYLIYNEEDGSGGRIENRKSYKKLLKDVEKKKINGIWVFQLSRLNRNEIENLKLFELCRNNEIKLFVENVEYDLNDKEVKLKLSMLSSFDSYFRENNSYVSISNKRKLLEDGYYVNGSVKFGYIRKNKKLVKSEIKEEVINKVLDWFIEGNNLNEIRKKLKIEYGNQELDGKVYNYNDNWIRNILIQDHYVTGIVEVSLKGEKYKFEVESFIDKEKWEKANFIYKTSLNRIRKNKLSDLEGKIYCSKCENNYVLINQKSIRKKDNSIKYYRYWRCLKCGFEKGVKRKRNIKKDVLENGIKRFIENYLLDEGFLKDELRNIIYQEYISEKENLDKKNNRVDFEKKINELEGKIERLKELYIDGDIDKNEFIDRKSKFYKKIEENRNKIIDNKSVDEEIESIINLWIGKMVGIENMNYLEFIDRFVDKIGVRIIERDYFKNGIFYKYNFIFKNQLINWSEVEKDVRRKKYKNENLLIKNKLVTIKI